MSVKRYSIVIGTYNHLDDALKPCLESIKKYTDLSTCEIIVVANGCTDGTEEYVNSLGEPFKLVSRTEPLGYAGAYNLGCSEATGEYLVLLNNDTCLLEQETNTWLKMLEHPFRTLNNVGVTGPLMAKSPAGSRDFLIFFCVMTPKVLFDRLKLNEDYKVGGAEDNEYCYEALKLGYSLVQVPNSDDLKYNPNEQRCVGSFPIFHHGEVTMRSLPEFDAAFKDNLHKLAMKYNPSWIKEVPPTTVLAFIPTRNRYDSLALTLQAIILQTHKPTSIIIFDDGEHKDLREDSIFKPLFELCEYKGIDWTVTFGNGRGQHYGHQYANSQNYTVVWRCFSGREKVETPDGLKNILDLQINDLVKTHRNRFKPITRVYKQRYPQGKEFLWVQTKHSTIKCTPEHPFLTKTIQGPKWVPATNLTTEHTLLYPNTAHKDSVFFNCWGRGRKKESAGKKYLNEYFGDINIDEDLARFFGLYLAEGCGGQDSIRFTFNNSETAYINFIAKICEQKFNRTPTIHKRWATTVKLNIRSFSARFIEWFGKTASEKKVPSFVFNWNLRNKLSFINGYLEGDGWNNAKMFRFSSASPVLVKGMRELLMSCGLTCSATKCLAAKENKKVKSNSTYSASINTQSVQKMYDLLEGGLGVDFIEIPVHDVIRKKWCSYRKKESNFVYNLEVEEDNSFIVGPVTVHNCDDDEVPEPDVLAKLLSHLEDGVGAVAGAVVLPSQQQPGGTSKLHDIFHTPNIQWSVGNQVVDVDHLYSSFIYRPGIVPFNTDLSPVAHREESLFSIKLKQAGYRLVVDTSAVTWHFRQTKGGIRDNNSEFFYEHDDKVFVDYLKSIGVLVTSQNNGIGDHYVFKGLLPELQKRYNHIILGCVYPQVFDGIDGVTLAPVNALDKPSNSNVYKFMQENKWTDSVENAFRSMYGL